jgi:hypothetical protein
MHLRVWSPEAEQELSYGGHGVQDRRPTRCWVVGCEELAQLCDVRRDPRVELHSAPLEDDLSTGDAKLTGALIESGETGGSARGGVDRPGLEVGWTHGHRRVWEFEAERADDVIPLFGPGLLVQARSAVANRLAGGSPSGVGDDDPEHVVEPH